MTPLLREKARTAVAFPLNRDECIRLTDALTELYAQAKSRAPGPFVAWVEHVAWCALNDKDWLA